MREKKIDDKRQNSEDIISNWYIIDNYLAPLDILICINSVYSERKEN
jgi:hypothetical protein